MTGAPLVALEAAVVRPPGRGPIGPLSLTLAPGEIVALVGASGCGKSTTLRMLAGLQSPDEGRVIRSVEPGRTGLVFQNPTLMPWAGALDNVALPLTLGGVPRARANAAAREALQRVGLGDRAGARPGQLSGGMAMRAALARALVIRPGLLLLDEPFAALDSVTRRRLIEDIHRLWDELGFAVVFVTHDVDEAAYMARRILVMRAADGRIAETLDGQGAVPRPDRWRADPRHLAFASAAASALERAMEPGT